MGISLIAACGSHTARTGPVAPREPIPEEPVQNGFCEPLPRLEVSASVIEVSPNEASRLPEIVAAASPGDTVSLADGTYELDGAQIIVSTPGLTVRSASGDREAVVLEGDYRSERVFIVNASNVTIADLTIRRARYHPIHAYPTTGDVRGVRIYNVHLIDSGRQAIKVNQDDGTRTLFVDEGEVACSRLELTDEGRLRIPGINEDLEEICYTGGFDAHQAWGWVIRDNHIEGFWCPEDIAQHGIHLWTGSRDTVVERNVLVNNARGIGFGLGPGDRPRRTYPDLSCDVEGDVDHWGGVIRNNFVVFNRTELFESEYGADCGICLWSACDARVVHNTVVSTRDPFSSIEWRFETTSAEVSNNLVSHTLMPRDGGRAELRGNLDGAPLDLFLDVTAGDLHLAESASAAIDHGETLEEPCSRDIDGDQRDRSPDIGADEVLRNR